MSLVCPYCNSPVPAENITPGASKIPCPNCGETIPNTTMTARDEQMAVAEGSPSPSSTTAVTTSAPAQSPKLRAPEPVAWSNRRIALVVLAIMFVMGGIGLGYALWTQEARRKGDYPEKLTTRNYDPVKPVAPEELPGLAHLPRECTVIAGVHVGELLGEDNGLPMFEELQRQLPMLNLETFEKWTGLNENDIHSITLGVPAKGALRLIVIVQTRGGYNINPIKKELTGIPGVNYENKPAFQLPNKLGYLWCINSKSMAFLFEPGAEVDALKAIRHNPKSLISDFPKDVQSALKERINRSAFAWTVATPKAARGLISLARWSKQLNTDLAEVLQKTNLVTASLRLHKGLALEANLQGEDVEAAKSIEKLFPVAGKGPEGATDYKIFGPASATDEKGKQDLWVSIQLRVELQKAEAIIGVIRDAIRGNKE